MSKRRRKSPPRSTPITGGQVATGSLGSAEPIDVDTVGPMVVSAIEANRPYCFTHPAPEAAIRGRAERLLDAYHPRNA